MSKIIKSKSSNTILRELKNITKFYDEYQPEEAGYDSINLISRIIMQRLNSVDRNIILVYLNCLNYSEVARLLEVNRHWVTVKIKSILSEIILTYNNEINKE